MKNYTKPQIEVISFETKNEMMLLSYESTGAKDNVIGIWDLTIPEIAENTEQ